MGISAHKKGVCYLHGVTGSGKTEIYVRLIADALQAGLGIIYLVPEISISSQTQSILTERFGDLVAVHHSAVPEKEKYWNWVALKKGEKRIVTGARSALFAPVRNLGLIIVDEEGDSSYKQDATPLYDARLAAEKLGELHGALVVLGSATPSLGSWKKIKDGDFHYFSIPRRYNQQDLPEFSLIDMKKEFRERNFSIFSRPLKEMMRTEFQKGNQVILFVNRRGYASFVMCRSCATVLECQRCKVSLTYHDSRELHCHYCDDVLPMPAECPHCGSKAIKFFGLGTQKVEDFFRREFPGVSYARLDTDITRKKGVLEETIAGVRSGHIQALIGTQMIAKGLDFENITLIAILNPDALVKMPDYSARERAFQLFVQIAGRAGRKDKKGRVILQTYRPAEEVFMLAKNNEVDEFVNKELYNRRELNFPPYYHLIQFLSTGICPEKARLNLENFHAKMLEYISSGLYIALYPVQSSPIEKIDGRYRFRSIMKAPYSVDLWSLLWKLGREHRSLHQTRLKIIADADNLL
jgi:primosomal protein N' (replication factor Y)